MYQWQAKSAAGRLSSRADFAKVSEGIAASLRQFSISARTAADDNPTTPRRLQRGNPSTTRSSSPNSSNSSTQPRQFQTPGRGAPRALDARSLGAARGGSAGGNMLRGGGMLLRGGFRGRGGAGAGGIRGGFRGGARGGALAGARGGRGGGEGGGRGGRGGGQGSGPKVHSRSDRLARNEVKKAALDQLDDTGLSQNLLEYFAEQVERDRPVPTPYDPEKTTKESLLEDWPALPFSDSDIERSATRAAEERVAFLSKRYAHGHEPVEYLAERYFEGELIAFESEEEKTAVLALVDEMNAKRAEKLSERKAEDVKPEDLSFQALSSEKQKLLLNQSLKGEYGLLYAPEPGQTPLAKDLLRNLTNNGTYNAEVAKRLVDKVQSMVPAKVPRSGKARPAAAAATKN